MVLYRLGIIGPCCVSKCPTLGVIANRSGEQGASGSGPRRAGCSLPTIYGACSEGERYHRWDTQASDKPKRKERGVGSLLRIRVPVEFRANI